MLKQISANFDPLQEKGFNALATRWMEAERTWTENLSLWLAKAIHNRFSVCSHVGTNGNLCGHVRRHALVGSTFHLISLSVNKAHLVLFIATSNLS